MSPTPWGHVHIPRSLLLGRAGRAGPLAERWVPLWLIPQQVKEEGHLQ